MIVLAENTQLVRQFRNLASCLDSGIVQFRPLQSYDDYIGFLDKYLCAYISNSSWDFNVFCSIVLGLRADGMVQLEIWQGEEQFDELYLRERLFTSVALRDLPYSVKRASFCLESAGGWLRIRECLQRELAFVSRTRSRLRGSIISYPVCRLCEVLHTGGDIAFGNELNPENGWALVLVGGSGSGKSAVLRRATNFQSKIFDVDDIKSAYNTAVRIKQNHPDWAPKLFASGDERIRDLSNQTDSEEIHKIMTEYRFDQRRQDLFFANLAGVLPNVAFDITGDNPQKLINIFARLKEIQLDNNGRIETYKTSLCFVVTNRDLAILNNLTRKRIVPEGAFHDIHDQVMNFIVKFLRYNSEDVDEAWIYFSTMNDARFARKEPELAKWIKQNRLIKLQKAGSGFQISPELESNIYQILGADSASVKYTSFDELISKDIRGSSPKGRLLKQDIRSGKISLYQKRNKQNNQKAQKKKN